MPDQLYLIRHAESELNTTPHIICGRSNETPLTAKGIDQAKHLGKYLVQQNIWPTAVYTSPAVRTHQTAQHCLDTMGIIQPPIVDDALQELNQGEWTGCVRAEIYTPERKEEFKQIGKDFKAPGGESMRDVGKRMRGWIDTKFDARFEATPCRNTQGDLVLFAVTHGAAIRCLLADLFDWSHEETYSTLAGNASLTRLSHEDRQWNLDYMGRNPE